MPKILKNKYVLTSIIFLVYFLFLDDLDIITIVSQKRKLNKLEIQRDYLAKDLKTTKNTLKELKNLNSLEAYARSKKFFKRDNEDIFVITYEKKKRQ